MVGGWMDGVFPAFSPRDLGHGLHKLRPVLCYHRGPLNAVVCARPRFLLCRVLRIEKDEGLNRRFTVYAAPSHTRHYPTRAWQQSGGAAAAVRGYCVS